MEQTTLQKRIEERAEARLLKDMWEAFSKQSEIQNMLGAENFPATFRMDMRYDSYNHKTTISCWDDASKLIFQKLLPSYVTRVTDEILSEIDQIKYLVENKDLAQADY